MNGPMIGLAISMAMLFLAVLGLAWRGGHLLGEIATTMRSLTEHSKRVERHVEDWQRDRVGIETRLTRAEAAADKIDAIEDTQNTVEHALAGHAAILAHMKGFEKGRDSSSDLRLAKEQQHG